MQPGVSGSVVVVAAVVVVSAAEEAVDNAVVDHVSTPEEAEVKVTMEEVPDDGLQRPAYTLEAARTTVNKKSEAPCFSLVRKTGESTSASGA
jgi:hypothetical protein